MVAILESEMATKGPEDNFDMLMWFNRAGLDIIGFAGQSICFTLMSNDDRHSVQASTTTSILWLTETTTNSLRLSTMPFIQMTRIYTVR